MRRAPSAAVARDAGRESDRSRRNGHDGGRDRARRSIRRARLRVDSSFARLDPRQPRRPAAQDPPDRARPCTGQGTRDRRRPRRPPRDPRALSAARADRQRARSPPRRRPRGRGAARGRGRRGAADGVHLLFEDDPPRSSTYGRCLDGASLRFACPPWPTFPGSSFSSAPLRFTGSTGCEHLGGEVEIWAKREDCNSGLAYGGNKARKLEYLAADALAQGCDTLVSIGGVQSNHTRQVAAVAAHLGLDCVLVQEHWVGWDDPVLRPGGEHPAVADHGCRRADVGRRFRHRLSPQLGGRALRGRGERREAVPHSRRSLRPPTRRARICAVGRRGGRAGGRARPLLRHDRRLLGHRLDASRDDRRLRRPGARARRAGNRRLRHRPADLGPDRPHRPPHGRGDRPRRDPSPTTRSSSSTSGTPAPTGSPTTGRSRRSGYARAWRECSPTRSTRGSRWRH